MVDSTESIGFSIRRIRRDKNITQAQLAEKVNLTQAAISSIERGGGVESGLARRIAAVLGVTVGELFGEQPVTSQSSAA